MPDRSIRNIEIHHRHRTAPPPPAQPQQRRRRPRRRRLWAVAIIVVIVAGALGILLSAVFAGASVSATPRTAGVTPPASIPAQAGAPVGTLSFDYFSVTLGATTTVAANGTQHVSRQASGVITIRNSYSSATQRLIANTRFEAPDGKIYRIRDSVVVPGGTAQKPGEASATAFADSPGPDYNRAGSTTYTIPGFKGDPRYSKITATSGPMEGGFVGDQPSVAAADLSAAKAKIEQQLDEAVRASFTNNVPADSQLIGNTLKVSFGDLVQTAAGGNQAALSETATAQGALVRTGDLAAAVAKQTVQGYQGEAVTFADPSSVQTSATSTAQGSLTIVMAQNPVVLVWVFDPNALKAALVGQPKGQFEAVIRQFEPAIAKADASIRPFWASAFPADPDKISISISQ